MKRETKLRGLENQLRALIPSIRELREDVVFLRECVEWSTGDRLYSEALKRAKREQVMCQRALDKDMAKYHKLNVARRKLRIIQKSKQLSIV